MTIADMSRFYGPDYTQPGTGGDGIGPEYSNWDAQSTTACYCDQGYFGPDCSSREWTNVDRTTSEPPKITSEPPKRFRGFENLKQMFLALWPNASTFVLHAWFRRFEGNQCASGIRRRPEERARGHAV